MQNKSLSITELQTAAFDWDNTLAYSREALVFAINKILPQYNLPQWDEVKQKGGFFSKPQPIDCDASAILLKDGKFRDKDDVVYFGQLKHRSGSVQHMGDNLTGAGDGDDEQIVIDLTKVPAEYDRIVIVVNIYAATQRKQHFGLIQNAFIRLVDTRNNNEMFRYDLTENYSGMTAMIFGELYRKDGEWKFSAIGQGTTDNSVGDLVKRYA